MCRTQVQKSFSITNWTWTHVDLLPRGVLWYSSDSVTYIGDFLQDKQFLYGWENKHFIRGSQKKIASRMKIFACPLLLNISTRKVSLICSDTMLCKYKPRSCPFHPMPRVKKEGVYSVSFLAVYRNSNNYQISEIRYQNSIQQHRISKRIHADEVAEAWLDWIPKGFSSL